MFPSSRDGRGSRSGMRSGRWLARRTLVHAGVCASPSPSFASPRARLMCRPGCSAAARWDLQRTGPGYSSGNHQPRTSFATECRASTRQVYCEERGNRPPSRPPGSGPDLAGERRGAGTFLTREHGGGLPRWCAQVPAWSRDAGFLVRTRPRLTQHCDVEGLLGIRVSLVLDQGRHSPRPVPELCNSLPSS